MNPAFIFAILSRVLPKKRIVGFVGAIVIAAVAIPLGMSSDDIRESICGPKQAPSKKQSDFQPSPEIMRELDELEGL